MYCLLTADGSTLARLLRCPIRVGGRHNKLAAAEGGLTMYSVVSECLSVWVSGRLACCSAAGLLCVPAQALAACHRRDTAKLVVARSLILPPSSSPRPGQGLPARLPSVYPARGQPTHPAGPMHAITQSPLGAG